MRYLAAMLLTGSLSIQAVGAEEAEEGAWVVDSDGYEVLLKSRQISYTGNVVATQGTYRIRAHLLNAYFNENNEIIRMEAFSNTTQRAELEALDQPQTTRLSGETLHYDLPKDRVTARGDTIFVRGPDRLTSHEIIYELTSEKVTANRSAKDRVRVVMFPEGTTPPAAAKISTTKKPPQ